MGADELQCKWGDDAMGIRSMRWWLGLLAVGLWAVRSEGLMSVKQSGRAVAFYVAPNGNDAWSGRLPSSNRSKTDGPFATLHRAVEAVRELKRQQGGVLKEPVTIFLRVGVHFLREPIVLTPEDSGTETAPITFAPYRHEKAIISGGPHHGLKAHRCEWQVGVGGGISRSAGR